MPCVSLRLYRMSSRRHDVANLRCGRDNRNHTACVRAQKGWCPRGFKQNLSNSTLDALTSGIRCSGRCLRRITCRVLTRDGIRTSKCDGDGSAVNIDDLARPVRRAATYHDVNRQSLLTDEVAEFLNQRDVGTARVEHEMDAIIDVQIGFLSEQLDLMREMPNRAAAHKFGRKP